MKGTICIILGVEPHKLFDIYDENDSLIKSRCSINDKYEIIDKEGYTINGAIVCSLLSERYKIKKRNVVPFEDKAFFLRNGINYLYRSGYDDNIYLYEEPPVEPFYNNVGRLSNIYNLSPKEIVDLRESD